MIVCVLIRRLALVAALGQSRCELMGEAVALAPVPGREQRVGEISPAAEAFGIVTGMRVGEALSRCPGLRLIPADPEAARAYWKDILDRLERIGAAPESDDPGVAWFEADGLCGLYGGHLDGVLSAARRVLPGGTRVAAASCRFAAYATAIEGRRGSLMTFAGRRGNPVLPPGATRAFLAPLSVGLLRTRPGLAELPDVLEQLGIRMLGQLAALSPSQIAERFGHPGLLAFELAHGRDTPLEPRRPSEPVIERLALPEAVSGPQLERALELLVARVLARRERRGRSLRVVALAARFVEGGTWRIAVPLRRATADPIRLCLALAPHLADLPAPAESLAIEIEAFGLPAHYQAPLAEDPGQQRRARLTDAVRHVRRAAGDNSVMRVLEIDPDSRLPERRAVLAPYPEPPA